MLKEIIAVFVGGGLGSILRFLISRISIINNPNFPLPTFISNILGCIFLGIFLSYFIKITILNQLFLFSSLLAFVEVLLHFLHFLMRVYN